MPRHLINIKKESNNPFPPLHFIHQSEEFTTQCVFCKKNHKSINCMTITERKVRKTILRRSGRYFVCLKTRHISPNCQSRVKCLNCGGRHHVTICENPENIVQSQNSVPQAASPNGFGTSHERIRDVGTATIHVGSNNNSVLLQTAQAFVCKPDNQKTGFNTHVIFDSYSKR